MTDSLTLKNEVIICIPSEKSEYNTWILYILECSDQSLYTGITNNLESRILAHQSGNGARYTRGRLPVKLMYTEEYPNRSEASKREYAVKKLTKTQKIELIKRFKHFH